MQAAEIRIADVAIDHGSPSGIASSEVFRPLLAGLLEELLNSTLLTAATASIANWMVVNQDRPARRNLVCYFPPPPAFFPQAMLKLCVNIDTIELSSRLRDYYDRLAFLRTLTIGFADRDGSEGDMDPVSIEVLAGAWQELAAAGRAAVCALGEHLCDGKSMHDNERHRTVLELLSQIELGNHPCVDAAGTVTVPYRTERRALQRRSMNVQAYIVVGESIERVAVLNASDKAIGVLGLLNASLGTAVHLLVRPGFSISGKVDWVGLGRAGISLDQSLPADLSPFALIN